MAGQPGHPLLGAALLPDGGEAGPLRAGALFELRDEGGAGVPRGKATCVPSARRLLGHPSCTRLWGQVPQGHRDALPWGNVEPGEKGEEDWAPPPHALCGGVRLPAVMGSGVGFAWRAPPRLTFVTESDGGSGLVSGGTLRLSGARQCGLAAPVSCQNCLGMPVAPHPTAGELSPSVVGS